GRVVERRERAGDVEDSGRGAVEQCPVGVGGAESGGGERGECEGGGESGATACHASVSSGWGVWGESTKRRRAAPSWNRPGVPAARGGSVRTSRGCWCGSGGGAGRRRR